VHQAGQVLTRLIAPEGAILNGKNTLLPFTSATLLWGLKN
jgi:hypothetical protein